MIAGSGSLEPFDSILLHLVVVRSHHDERDIRKKGLQDLEREKKRKICRGIWKSSRETVKRRIRMDRKSCSALM